MNPLSSEVYVEGEGGEAAVLAVLEVFQEGPPTQRLQEEIAPVGVKWCCREGVCTYVKCSKTLCVKEKKLSKD